MAAKNTCADCRHFTRAVRLMDAKRRDPGKPKRKYDAKKRAPKLKRTEADA